MPRTEAANAAEPLAYKNYFKFAVLAARVTGFQMLVKPDRRSIVVRVYEKLTIMMPAFLLILEYRFFVAHLDAPTFVKLKVVICAVYNMQAIIRTILLTINRPQLKELYDEMPKMFPSTVADQKLIRIEAYQARASLMAKFNLGYMTFSNVVNGCRPFIMPTIEYFTTGHYTYFHSLDVAHEYPFAMNSVFTYLLANALDIFNFIGMTYVNVRDNLYFYYVSLLMCVNYDLMAERIERLKTDSDRESIRNIAKIIMHHNKTMRVCEKISQVYGPLLFFTIFSTTVMICAMCLTIVKEFKMNFLLTAPVLLSEVMTIFFICYCGNRLLEASEKFRFAVYSHDWISGSLRYKKIIIIMMQASNKLMYITAGLFFKISFETFQMVINNSYALIALLI